MGGSWLSEALKSRVPFIDAADGRCWSPKWCSVDNAKAAADVGENISSSLLGTRVKVGSRWGDCAGCSLSPLPAVAIVVHNVPMLTMTANE